MTKNTFTSNENAGQLTGISAIDTILIDTIKQQLLLNNVNEATIKLIQTLNEFYDSPAYVELINKVNELNNLTDNFNRYVNCSTDEINDFDENYNRLLKLLRSAKDNVTTVLNNVETFYDNFNVPLELVITRLNNIENKIVKLKELINKPWFIISDDTPTNQPIGGWWFKSSD